MKTIAITGGIGSGKTVVSNILRASGYPVYDCDERAKILTAISPEIKKGLISIFGENIYGEEGLNKKLLAERLFADAQTRTSVNSIIHPVVFADFDRWRSEQNSDTVFIESAILYESRLDKFVDEVWCVTAPQEVRIARVEKRNGMPRKQIEERMASQLSDETMRSKATHVILNDDETPVLPQLLNYFPNI